MKLNFFLFCLLLSPFFAHAQKIDGLYKLSNQRRGENFRNGASVSKAGNITALLGTGILVSGLFFQKKALVGSGSFLFAIGLPTHGLGTLKMRNAATPGTGISPNGWYWYGISWIFKATFLTSILVSDSPHPILFYSTLGGSTICSLASWAKFSNYRKRLVKSHPEFSMRVNPAFSSTNFAKPGLEIVANISF